MSLFKKGQHSLNKKYERFSEVYIKTNKYRKKTRLPRSRKSGPDSASDEFALPSRRADRFTRRKLGRRLGSLWPFKYIGMIFAFFDGRMRAMREAHESAVLGYVPIKLFIGLCLITMGLYPYIWIWNNAYAFNKLGDRRVTEASFKRLAALGFAAQSLLPISAAFYAAGRFFDARIAIEISYAVTFALVAIYLLAVFPMRCFNYFCVRWALRSAVIKWDIDGVMVGRAMPSWFKLFLFGSVYIQRHINRLMGLGMPGFADVSEIESDATLGELIESYVLTEKTDRIAAHWTKDNFEPEYDEDPDYEDEEYDGRI
jgi:hypothetical protein